MVKILCLILLVISLHHTAFSSEYSYDLKAQDGFIILSNGKSIEVAISPKHGGELTGFKVKHLNKWHELIYRAKDYSRQEGWRGKAWLLWPATGPSKVNHLPLKANKIGYYQINNQIKTMPMHGFAKDMAWTLSNTIINQDSASVTLSIEETQNTLNYYPFGFTLSVTYQLKGDNLTIKYLVHAKESNQEVMPFSIGNHITFNAPLIKSGKASDFSFTTSSNLQLERINGLPTGKTLPSKFINKTPLEQLPEKKSISLVSSNNSRNNQASITLFDTSGLKININHTASLPPKNLYIDFNLWGSNNERFFSPEPWIGAQNSLNTGLGLTKLKPNEQWLWDINIGLFHTDH